MRSRIPAAIQGAGFIAALLILLLIGCQAPASSTGAAAPARSADAALADRLDKLPTLPADLAATLDPKTNMTKIAVSELVPVKLRNCTSTPCPAGRQCPCPAPW